MTAIPCIETDVVVCGAGPAGSAFALNLAAFYKVVLLDNNPPAMETQPAPGLRIGESLPAAAGNLLKDMGLWEQFQAQQHRPCHLHRSVWGNDTVNEQDAMRNLDGHGWFLDRVMFDRWLQKTAQHRGATLLSKTKLIGLRQADDGVKWHVTLTFHGKPVTFITRFLVDASGRNATIAKQLGSKREIQDKLVCGWVYGHDSQDSGAKNSGGSSELQAEAGGWWYTSPLPDNGRIVSFYTDADLPQAKSAHNREALLQRLNTMPWLQQQLRDYGFVAEQQYGFCAAHSTHLDSPVGKNWLAIGDAALAFDPLSSQGLFNALYTGLTAAHSVYQYLGGDVMALTSYRAELNDIHAAYANHLDSWYAEETRWCDHPFWQRRHAKLPTHSTA
ncbi:NAD(P)/FAD-dependent oxidoreductase [Glaciimonas sp. GG7]